MKKVDLELKEIATRIRWLAWNLDREAGHVADGNPNHEPEMRRLAKQMRSALGKYFALGRETNGNKDETGAQDTR